MGTTIRLANNETFINLCLNGKSEPEQIDDYVDQWHETDDSETRQLHEYLGFTVKEYSIWMLKPAYLAYVLQSRAAIVRDTIQ